MIHFAIWPHTYWWLQKLFCWNLTSGTLDRVSIFVINSPNFSFSLLQASWKRNIFNLLFDFLRIIGQLSNKLHSYAPKTFRHAWSTLHWCLPDILIFWGGSSCWLRVGVRMRVGVVGRTSVRRSCGNCQFFSILSSILYARLTNFPQNLILFYEVEKRFIKEVLILKKS